jgi:hypothetical protein
MMIYPARTTLLNRFVLTKPVLIVLTAVLIAVGLFSAQNVRAGVSDLYLTRRSCATVSAFLTYDSFSEGRPPYFATFSVDLNGNGVYGEASEPTQRIRVRTGGGLPTLVNARMAWAALPQGSTISVIAYETDSSGAILSEQLGPVTYQCTQRPAVDRIPSVPVEPAPVAGVTARALITLPVYSGASAQSQQIGGLADGMVVTVLALNERGDWAQIEYRGSTGWIMWRQQAILIGPYAELPRLPNYEQTNP